MSISHSHSVHTAIKAGNVHAAPIIISRSGSLVRLSLGVAPGSQAAPAKRGVVGPVEFTQAISAALNIKDKLLMQSVFDRHSDSKKELSAPALMAALEEVEAPVLCSKTLSAEDIFRRADANLSGAVDFDECKSIFHYVCLRFRDQLYFCKVHAHRPVARRT
jgi:hypothetical protein